jgi:hypothetical protein
VKIDEHLSSFKNNANVLAIDKDKPKHMHFIIVGKKIDRITIIPTTENIVFVFDAIVKTESTDFGQAGSLSYNENTNQTSKEVKASSNSALSSSTKSQLDNIADVKQSSSSLKQTSSNQSLSKIDEFDWIQGSMRELQIPKDPKIIISEESGRLLDSTREVIISFTVLEDGSVINIKITPSSVLAPQIQSEIKEQLYNWHFEASDSISLASFRCILQKK